MTPTDPAKVLEVVRKIIAGFHPHSNDHVFATCELYKHELLAIEQALLLAAALEKMNE